MISPHKRSQYQQHALRILQEQVQTFASIQDNPQELMDELRYLFIGIDACPHDAIFIETRLQLINILKDMPVRYGMSDQWDDLTTYALQTTPSDDAYHLGLLHWIKAKIAYDRVQRQKARDWISTAWGYAHQSKNPKLIGDIAQTFCSSLVYHFGEHENAIDMIYQAKEAISELNTPVPYRLDISLADALRRLGKIWQARRILETMAEKWLTPHLPMREQAIILHNLGLMRWVDGAYATAQSNLQTAAHIYEDLHELATACGAYGDLGLCLWAWGKLQQAETVYNKAIRLAQKAGDAQREMKLHGNLGLVYMSKGRLDEAETYILAHIQRAETLDSPREVSRARGNLAQLAMYRGNPHNSLPYLQEALNAHQHPNEGRGNDLILVCICHLHLGNRDQALNYLHEAYKTCDEGEHTILPILVYRAAAECYPDQAEAHLTYALSLAKQYDRRLDMVGCLLKLAQICHNDDYRIQAHNLLQEMGAEAWLNYGEAPLLPLMI
ncbi:MAG: tetratricopeptide repeat protein [bacterium]|nr:tetratricopeptide repeat protein [bacterium]